MQPVYKNFECRNLSLEFDGKIYVEEWKPIIGYEGYEISSFGRVKSLAKTWLSGSNQKFVKTKPDTILRSGNRNKYRSVTIFYNGIKNHVCLHRLVASHFIENKDNLPEVNHIDGDKLNNFYKNIEWVTSSENQIHAFKKGLQKPQKGEKHGGAKLSEQDVLDIKQMWASGDYFQKEIAKKFNVTQSRVSLITSNKSWNHLVN